MTDENKIEIAARALARYRLGHNELMPLARTHEGRQILVDAVEKLWPTLTDQARAVVEALESEPSVLSHSAPELVPEVRR